MMATTATQAPMTTRSRRRSAFFWAACMAATRSRRSRVVSRAIVPRSSFGDCELPLPRRAARGVVALNDRRSAIVPSVGEDEDVPARDDSPRTSAAAPLRRVWRTDREIHLRAQLGVFRRGGGDPTSRWGADRSVVRACQTPEGVGTLHLLCRPGACEVEAQAWGPGSEWLLESVPGLLGDGDDPAGFEPAHDLVADAWRRFSSWRVPRSGLLFDALAPAVIEQKVAGQEAFGGYRVLVRRYGTPAPGPVPGLMAPPTPAAWAAIPSWAWLQASVDGGRSRTVVRAAGFAGRLEQGAGLGL